MGRRNENLRARALTRREGLAAPAGRADRAASPSRLSLRPPPLRAPGDPSPKQLDDACMYFRHDFGLLSEDDKNRVRWTAYFWLQAWRKALAGEQGHRAEP